MMVGQVPRKKEPPASLRGDGSPTCPPAIYLVNHSLEKWVDILEPGSKATLIIRDPKHHHHPLFSQEHGGHIGAPNHGPGLVPSVSSGSKACLPPSSEPSHRLCGLRGKGRPSGESEVEACEPDHRPHQE